MWLFFTSKANFPGVSRRIFCKVDTSREALKDWHTLRCFQPKNVLLLKVNSSVTLLFISSLSPEKQNTFPKISDFAKGLLRPITSQISRPEHSLFLMGERGKNLFLQRKSRKNHELPWKMTHGKNLINLHNNY